MFIAAKSIHRKGKDSFVMSSVPTLNNCGGSCGEVTDGKQCFVIPPNIKFGVTALINAVNNQTIKLFIDDQLTDTLTGAGLNDTTKGTKVYSSGKGNVCVAIEVNGKPSKLRFADNPLAGKPGIAVVGSEDGTDNDFNDSVVVLNWPLT